MKFLLGSLLALMTLTHAHDFSQYAIIDAALKKELRQNWQGRFKQSGYVSGNVAVFGNSITEPEAFWNPFGDPGSVAGIVPGTNQESYLTDKMDRNHCAVSGYTIGAGLACVDTALFLLKPEVAVCLYGTNDTWSGDTASYKARYRVYLDKLLAKGTIPIICTIPPLRAFYGDSTYYDSMTATWNNAVRALADEHNVVLADYWQGVMDYTNNNPFTMEWYEDQFVHPSPCSVAGLTDVENPGCGQGIHNAVAWEAVNKAYRIIIENGAPDSVSISDKHLVKPVSAVSPIEMTVIYNTRGKVVMQWQGSAGQCFNGLHKGVYLERKIGTGSEYCRKIVLFK